MLWEPGMHILTAVSSIPGTRTYMMCFLGTWDWIFNIGIPWGFGDSMVWGSWELGPWGLLKAVGLRGTGELGTCTLEFGIPSLRMGSPNFGVPQRGKSLLKK